MLNRILVNALQVATLLALSPLIGGVLSRLKEIVQSKRGPSVLQPYRDLWKLFHKDEIVSTETPRNPRDAVCGLRRADLVTLLIPVLTTYPLFLAFMADMVGVGFSLALGGFFAALGAIDAAYPYGATGGSRTRIVSFLAEPVFMIVFFTVSFVAGSTIPYIVQKQWTLSVGAFRAPPHILLIAAFLMLILAEADRIPVDNPTGHFELAMIGESKALEYSGRGAALMKWGGHMKLMVLMCVFLNVLVSPWGLAGEQGFWAALLAIPLIALKILALVLIIVVIESSLAKLRLFRITEFLGAAFITCVAAMISRVFTSVDLRAMAMSIPSAAPIFASLNALAGGLFLLSAFAMIATRQTRGCLLLFILSIAAARRLRLSSRRRI